MPKDIILAASLPAPPERLFEMYVDPKAHAELTGSGPVQIGCEPGAAFEAFGGMLKGRILHTERGRLVVQTWRSGRWPAESPDSILVLRFIREDGGGRVELHHLGVADEDFAGVSHGWEKFYWTPWRALLSAEAGS